MPDAARFSPHFTVAEMIESDVARRHNFNNSPNGNERIYLADLCNFYLEPVRSLVARPLRVTSGYRCPELNTLIGGARYSAHIDGRAADIKVKGLSAAALMRRIYRSELMPKIDQLILEYGGWVHLGIARRGTRPRAQALIISVPGLYLPYTPPVE